ncbi:RTA1 domain-containing protein [Aspergillus affinis]|uniref:RTA1 domain-containing protein n=1 Tax=Aspergillus affinis TaxID=1070780 RepID=UPI0022FEE5C5|nr:putative RTA1 domain protein [Aspergillus affinis]KAI9043838.1 putative RTA1 domain protein [Aspergillus affinis]
MSSTENIYFYNPSLAASILFTILYFLPLLYHIYMTFLVPRANKSHRPGSFIPILIGALLEVAGYAIRCASIKQPTNIPLYATSATLIVIAPVFVCASLYVLTNRLIQSSPVGEKPRSSCLPICVPLSWLPRIFITLDIISCLTQGSGSGIASAGDWEGDEKDTGVGVLIGGLVLQLVTFSGFLVIVGSFHGGMKVQGKEVDGGVRMMLKGVYIAGFFIMVRSIYRVVEFAMGIDAYAFNHEWPLYVLEAVPMVTGEMMWKRIEDRGAELGVEMGESDISDALIAFSFRSAVVGVLVC